jgi:hypothetical protein
MDLLSTADNLYFGGEAGVHDQKEIAVTQPLSIVVRYAQRMPRSICRKYILLQV